MTLNSSGGKPWSLYKRCVGWVLFYTGSFQYVFPWWLLRVSVYQVSFKQLHYYCKRAYGTCIVISMLKTTQSRAYRFVNSWRGILLCRPYCLHRYSLILLCHLGSLPSECTVIKLFRKPPRASLYFLATILGPCVKFRRSRGALHWGGLPSA